jgi:hypothetical protein
MTPEESLRRTINEAVESAVRRVLADRPIPSTVTLKQAAEMLDVSERTIRRMNPPKVAGNMIAYSWVAARLSSK